MWLLGILFSSSCVRAEWTGHGSFRGVQRKKRETFNTLISAHSTRGAYDQSMNIYKRMKEAGVTPDLSTYNVFLAVLAQGGRWDQSGRVFTELCFMRMLMENELIALLFKEMRESTECRHVQHCRRFLCCECKITYNMIKDGHVVVNQMRARIIRLWIGTVIFGT